MSLEDAERTAGAWQDSLVKARFEQETQRDKTLVLISGGALTVTFAFITSLLEHGHLMKLGWLIAAWSSWALVLVLSLVAYSISISTYTQVINALSVGDWGNARKTPRLAAAIEPLNLLISALTVAGFLSFGYFAVSILESTFDEQENTRHRWENWAQEGRKEIQRQSAQSQLAPAAAPRTSAPSKK